MGQSRVFRAESGVGYLECQSTEVAQNVTIIDVEDGKAKLLGNESFLNETEVNKIYCGLIFRM